MNSTTNQLPLDFNKRMTRVLSYGGGLDSFAMLVDAIQRNDKPDVCAMVDVGDPKDRTVPGEWPSTYRHVEEVVKPLCAANGIEFVMIYSNTFPVRDASSLFAWLWARYQIPMAGPGRICTIVAKVERFEKWLAARYGEQQVEVWVGFEAGEENRAAKDPNSGKSAQRVNRFPLIERQLCRCRCEALVRAAGYPVPRKSACVFCPYGSKRDWQTLAAECPEQFAKIAELEDRKPATKKNGLKLSIMGYHTTKHADGTKTVRAPMLAE